MVDGITPGKAFLLGLGLMAISAKFWVFTLGAIAVIGDAGMDPTASIVAFLIFVALAESVMLALIVVAYLLPARSAVILDRVSALLQKYNRALVIGLGLVFGTWFLIKALDGLGVL